jgi:PAS domain S-box-containing protein
MDEHKNDTILVLNEDGKPRQPAATGPGITKRKMAEKLIIANKELAFQNTEKEKRTSGLIVANEELAYQNDENEKCASELILANKELAHQNAEKEKRASELIVANKELAYQNKEKEKRASELTIANKELAYQNKEKEKRAFELTIANKELFFQNEKKKKQANKLKKAKNLYAFISQINQRIAHVKDEDKLFKNACRIALEFGKFKIAWIGIYGNANQTINLVHQVGLLPADIKKFKNVPLQANGPQKRVLHTSKYYLCNDILNDPELAKWPPLATERKFCSCMILPFKKSGNVIGTFNLYAEGIDFFQKDEIAMLLELTGDISYALDTFEKDKLHRDTAELVVQNEKRFRSLIEQSADMITLAHPDGELMYVSNSVTKMLGYSSGELLHMSVFDIIHPDDIPEVKKIRDKVVKTPGKSIHYLQRRRHKNGTWIWCEGTLTNLLNEPGINALVSNFRDVSQKKKADVQQEFDRNNLDALINNTNDLMWSVDKDFNMITSNQPFDDIMELMAGKALEKGGNILKTSFSREQSKRYRKFYKRALAGEAFTEIEYTSAPVEFWSEISFYPIRKGVEVVGTACHSRDITAAIKSERQLVKSEIFNRGVLDSLSSHIAVIDGGGNIIAVNEAWSRFALENGETTLQRTGIGSNYFDVCERAAKSGDETAETACSGIKDVMDEKRPVFYLEYPCFSPGEQRWFGMRVTKFESDEPMVVVAHHDISERKLAEENLLQSEARLKEAQAIAHIGNFEIDLATSAEVWSDEMYKMCGINKEEIAPTADLFLSTIHPEDVAHVQAGFGECLKSFHDSNFNFRYIGKDGTSRYGFIKARFEFDKNKSPIRLFGVFQDVTAVKLAEAERIKMVNDLLLRNTELEQFGYIISHNLRAPVANIIGASSLLNELGLTAEDKEILNKGLNVSVTKLDAVVKDLNHILQAKSDIKESKEIVHFSTLVEDIKLGIQRMIDKYGIEITYDFSEINRFLTLRAFLYSIFYNLISNSIKYRRRQIPCAIQIKSRLEKNKFELIFTDNGIGINLEKSGGDIFGLYKRFHSHIEGKGMGLFMVKTQVETLGGKISVKSIENEGTTFTIEFEL